jgi:hypothetical protein
MTCNVRQNAIDFLKEKKYITDMMVITNPMFFYEIGELFKIAKTKYGVKTTERPFVTTELPSGNLKAVPNDTFFTELQSRFDAYQAQDMVQGSLFQKSGESVSSKASPQVVKLVTDFLDRIGVNIQTVKEIAVNGVRLDANAVANITQKLVQVVEGKEAQALPEEAMHFVVEIIKQTNPKLYQKLLSEINGYNTLKQVFADYSSDPNYQTKDGKPNVQKLKDEAIAKVLAETIIRKSEGVTEKPELLSKTQSWWKSILDWIKELFSKSGFDRAAMDVLSGKNIGNVDDIRSEQDNVYLQKTSQSSVYDMLKQINSKITKKMVEVNGEMVERYFFEDKQIPRRVSDDINDWYERRFKNKDLTDSEYTKAVNDLKGEKGTLGHKDFENIFDLFIDENGYIRENPLDDSNYQSMIDPDSRDIYEILKENFRQRINTFPSGTRFLSEVAIYDAKRGIAGTVDFLAITSDGKVNILDWKFTALNVDKYEDIPWYKVSAWNQQMGQYKVILEKVYGVKSSDFDQTRMIPILAKYSEGNAKKNILPKLEEVRIGDVDVKNIEQAYLLPVGLETEKTGNKKIDKLLEKLNATYRKISEQKVLPSEKLAKTEQLNALFTAIRQLQMRQNIKPLIEQAKIFNKQVNNVIKKYEDQFKGKDAKSFTEEQRDNFYDELETAESSLDIYTELDTELSSLFTGELDEEAAELEKDLNKTVGDARKLRAQLEEVSEEYISEIIAKSEDVEDIVKPERSIKGIAKWFASTATIQLKSMQVLFKKANRALAYAGMDALTESKNLQTLKAAYDNWAKGKGLSIKNYFDIIKKKDKNELIDEFNPEFYGELKKHIQDKDFKWIRENIDVDAYKAFIEQKLADEFERIESKPRIGTDDEIAAKIASEKFKAKDLYDLSTPSSVGWLIYDDVKKFPKRETWESTEWKTLTAKGNEAAKNFYDYIRKKNEEYADLGYINKKYARVFLPFVRKGLTEKLIFGGNASIGEQFLRNITLDEGDFGFGQTDPRTGRPIDTIPVYFTKEVDGEMSTDLFRTMALYNEMAIKYKYLNTIDSQARALVNLERNKKAIATSPFGKTKYDRNGDIEYTPDNNTNTKLVEDMTKAIIYGQKFLDSETFDQVLGKVGKWGEKINKSIGVKLFPENLSERQISLNKTITQINNTFQLQALGLNPLSALSNLFGGSAQSVINSGRYFKRNDFTSSELWLLAGKMTGAESAKDFIAALEYFLPLTDNYNKQIAKTLSLSKLSQENIQEFIMILMRESDMLIQTANFRAFLKNSVVIDNKIVNAREYVRKGEEYQNRYSLATEQRKAVEAKFEKDVEALIAEKGVMKLGKVVDGEFVIPGVDRKDESVIELRRKVQQISKDALGNLSEDDQRLINLNIWGKSFMVFKNWIPRPADVRFGNLKYNSASDAYEWGRMRMVYRIMSENVLSGLGKLKDSLVANEQGVVYMRELYEKKKAEYEELTGKTLELTEAEFMDLVRQNIKSQMRDTLILLTLFSIFIALKALAPDDDEDPIVKNQYKFLLKATDKLRDEIMYFYNPTSVLGLVSTGIFPSMRLVDNYSTLVKNFMLENYYVAVGDEEMAEKNFVIKYAMKGFPVTSVASSYLPMFYPELAKDLGIKMQSKSGIR